MTKKKKNSDRILMIQITQWSRSYVIFFIMTSIIPVQTIHKFNIPLRFEGVEQIISVRLSNLAYCLN